jgi:hypothetical protein
LKKYVYRPVSLRSQDVRNDGGEETRGRIMSRSIPEKDWKYLRSIEAELLSDLCRKINQSAAEILCSEYGSEHEKYLTLYKHVEASDGIIADCFDDWRRSTLWLKLPLLRRHNLLMAEHIINLSEASRELLGKFDTLDKE